MTSGGNKFYYFPQMQLINCELLRGLIHCMSPMAQILGLKSLGPHEVGVTANYKGFLREISDTNRQTDR